MTPTVSTSLIYRSKKYVIQHILEAVLMISIILEIYLSKKINPDLTLGEVLLYLTQ